MTVAGRLEGKFEIVFADPPYADDPFAELFGTLSDRGCLAEGATVFAEHGKRLVLPTALRGLRQVDRREYGDSAVTVYRADGQEGTAEGAGDRRLG